MPFEELPHTADWALRVWAANLPALFSEAARGMNALSGAALDAVPRLERDFVASGADAESLLVAFLSELVYYAEQEHTGFDSFGIELGVAGKDTHWLRAVFHGARLSQLHKAIKAVTYHRLDIVQTAHGYEVTIVFDV